MKRSWSWREWLPNAAALTLNGVTTTAAGVQVEANGPSSGRCPRCGHRSCAYHSHYWRTLKDLPRATGDAPRASEPLALPQPTLRDGDVCKADATECHGRR